jgi:hypothetical protein
MRQYHLIAGYAIVGGWALLFLWGVALWILRRDAPDTYWALRIYWALLAVLQILVGLQVVAGVVLFAMGGRPEWLHYLYGAVGPLVVLAIAHVLTSGLDKPPRHAVLTVCSFFVFGLTSRALMTGLGAG